MPQKKYATRIPISIEFNGKKHTGSYYVEKGMVTIESEWGTKSTQVHASPAELLAQIMLREMVEAAEGRKP